MTSVLLVVGGLILLALGGEALIRGAVLLARLAGVSAAVIGLTVVAAGTSLPELAVSVLATLHGGGDLAVANVIGSNIFNVSLALGLTALLSPLPVRGPVIRLEWPVLFGSALACTFLLRDAVLSRPEGAFLVAALVAFMAYSVHLARAEVSGRAEAQYEATAASRMLARRRRTRRGGRGGRGGRGAGNDRGEPGDVRPERDEVDVQVARSVPGGWAALAAVLVGAVLLVAGGHLLVQGAVGLARMAGLSERLIGLTVVAVGTGMPELATSLVAAWRERAEVAVANLIGSNIFNALGILGAAALVHPIRVSPALVRSDALWMIGVSALLLPVLWSGGRVRRLEGAILVAAYGAYLLTLIL